MPRSPRPASGVLTFRLLVALASVYVIWGSTYLAIKFAVAPESGRPLPSMVMPAMRFGISGLLLFAWAVRRPAADGQPDPIGWPQWRATAIIALALLVGGNGLVTVAESRGLDSGITAVVVAMTPLWAALIGVVRRDARPARIVIVGLVMGFVGVAVLVWPSSTSHIDTGAALIVVAASLSWASGSYYSQRAPLPRRPLVTTGMEMLVGSAAFTVISAVNGELSGFEPSKVSPGAWWALAYLTVVGGMIAYTAYVWLLGNAPLSLATTYAYVNPIVAVFLGWLVGSEHLDVRDIGAATVVILSVALIMSTHRTRSETAAATAVVEPSRAVIESDSTFP